MTESQRQALVDVIDWTYLIDQIQEHFEPEQVFTTEQLDEWAENSGYVKSDDK